MSEYRVVTSTTKDSYRSSVVLVPSSGECSQYADCGEGSAAYNRAIFVAAALNSADTDGNGVVDP